MAYRAYFDGKREFGIELEGYGLSRLEIVEELEKEKISAYPGDGFSEKINKWVVGTDGTIKRTYPIEVTSPPLSGEKSFDQIEKVCQVLNKIGLKTDSSCGFHVHWNVSDYTGRSTINLLRLYAKYENILDYFFDESRRGDVNKNSRSLIKENGIDWTYKLNRPFHYLAYQVSKEFERTQPLEGTSSQPSARHHKVNICAINKYGTIEFRQHEGTFDFEKIINWIIFSQQLINRAKDTIVGEGPSTWENLVKTLAMTDSQLGESVYSPDKKFIRETREFYRKKYRQNQSVNSKEKENAYVG